MEWTNKHRERLYRILEGKWAELDTDPWEEWLLALGIEWAELQHEKDSPPGTIAVWEGPGEKDRNLKMCWVLPDESALKLLTLDFARET